MESSRIHAATMIPDTLTVNPESIPEELQHRDQWVCWRWESRGDAWTKVPLDPATGRRAATDNAATWGSFAAALARYRRDSLAGVGFVFTAADPFAGVDLDDCYDPATGARAPEAGEIVSALGTYTERSPRGRGLKLIVRAALPEGRGRRDARRGIEMYDRGRFFTITGAPLDGYRLPCAERQDALDTLYGQVFPLRTVATAPTAPPTRPGALTDMQIVTRAIGAANGEKFRALWAGDAGGYGSRSEADAALCALLAFWTGPDPAWIDTLFRQSGLYRDKWERADYRAATIAKALEGKRDYFTAGADDATRAASAGPDDATGTADAAINAATTATGAARQEEKSPNKSQATKLVELVEAARVALFHSPDGDAYATIPIDGHAETWPLRASHFRHWLMRQFFECHGSAPGSQAVQDALGVLTGKALYAGPELPVFVRVAEAEGAIWIDLGDNQWRAVRITSEGWSVEAGVPVKFARAKGMAALPMPVGGGSLELLRPLVNAGDDQTWQLIVSWLIGALRPRGPYPLLALHGEQGSAKSTTARALKALIDPHAMPLRAEPKHEQDLMIAATNGWALAFDNLSRLPVWLSDALCRLSTGGGFGTRELYSNRDEVLFSAMRPLILNGIEDLATRPDLLERAIVRWLPAIPESQRRTEAAYWREFEGVRPQVLGALYDAVSAALRYEATTRLTSSPRMADFAVWVSAAEGALGWRAGTFLAAYSDNRADSHMIALEAWPVFAPLGEFAERYDRARPWRGTATELLGALNGRAEGEMIRRRDWPKDATRLSGQLRRYAAELRAIGITVNTMREGGRERKRLLTVCTEVQNKPTIGVSAASVLEPSSPSTAARGVDAHADAAGAVGRDERPGVIGQRGEAVRDVADVGDAADATEASLFVSGAV